MGCYRSLRSYPDSGVSGAAADGSGSDGGGGDRGGSTGSGGQAGTGGGANGGTGGSATGSGGSGGSGPTFVGGPCIVTPDHTGLEAFARVSDGHIYRRAFDGNTWGGWTNIAALDGTILDARSDLDCGAQSSTSVHIVATGLNPIGALLHAVGSGTVYNAFQRELSDTTFSPGPSIYDFDDTHYTVGALGSASTFPVVYELGDTSTPNQLTPITTETDSFRSGPDIAVQPTGASKHTYFAAFDYGGALAIYDHVISSAGSSWAAPVKLSAPEGTFAFSPTICVQIGEFGVYSVNVAAVAGTQLWYANAPSISSAFSDWTPIAADPTSAPDCAIVGADGIVHVVVLSAAGILMDVNGKGTSWVATDLGVPR